MQVTPNWTSSGSPEEFETHFKIPFKGPGLYVTETDTILVTTDEMQEGRNPWAQVWPEGTVFNSYVYNGPFHNTFFAHCGRIPSRGN